MRLRRRVFWSGHFCVSCHMRTSLVSALVAAHLLLAGCDGQPVEPSVKSVDVNSPEFKKVVQERMREMEKEELVVETSPWFGRTGLSAEIERELPRYLRRELGQTLSQAGAIRASDLQYLGVFNEGVEVIHYWRVPLAAKEPVFAYVVAEPSERRITGWGGRHPTK